MNATLSDQRHWPLLLVTILATIPAWTAVLVYAGLHAPAYVLWVGVSAWTATILVACAVEVRDQRRTRGVPWRTLVGAE